MLTDFNSRNVSLRHKTVNQQKSNVTAFYQTKDCTRRQMHC